MHTQLKISEVSTPRRERGGGGKGGWGGGHSLYKHGYGCADKRGLIFKICLKRGWRGCFIVKNLGGNSNMPVWKGVHVCLERG